MQGKSRLTQTASYKSHKVIAYSQLSPVVTGWIARLATALAAAPRHKHSRPQKSGLDRRNDLSSKAMPSGNISRKGRSLKRRRVLRAMLPLGCKTHIGVHQMLNGKTLLIS